MSSSARTRFSIPLVAALGLAPATAGCDNPNPGTPLGTFSVTSTLSTDTCGGTAADPDPGSFDVTLSNDKGIVYWFPNTGASAASGAINAARTVSIAEVVADDVDAVDGSAGACTLQRNDTLTFTLAAGATPASFTGTYSFTVSPAIGANCSDQLTSHGGGYSTLPCTITYTLAGAHE
jgi:hypothetical protein